MTTVAKFYAVFLGNMTYMKQAHLRAKFVEVLWRFTPERRDGNNSPFFQVFVTDPISEQFMVPALVSYVWRTTLSLPPPCPSPSPSIFVKIERSSCDGMVAL